LRHSSPERGHDPQERLFTGKFAADFVFTDRAVQESGDLGKIAFLSYGTLELSIHAPRSPLMPLVRQQAAQILARRGQWEQISSAGQGVILGHGR